ncbi:MAG TPA: hypothetical protein VLJ38_00810 [Polyangiaceae bacterium]|nr:hypothetical protein [Polyangiaceae bacterium]
MPCFVGCIAVAFPRLALFLVWFFGDDYFSRAFGTWLWPLLGFFFLPLTTLAFAFGVNTLGRGGEMGPLGWLLVLVALAGDLGLLRGGAHGAKAFRSRRGDWRPPA